MRGAARAEDLKGEQRRSAAADTTHTDKLSAATGDTVVENLDSWLRHTNLPAASTVVLPADDGERSFAGYAGVAGLIGHPVWRI